MSDKAFYEATIQALINENNRYKEEIEHQQSAGITKHDLGAYLVNKINYMINGLNHSFGHAYFPTITSPKDYQNIDNYFNALTDYLYSSNQIISQMDAKQKELENQNEVIINQQNELITQLENLKEQNRCFLQKAHDTLHFFDHEFYVFYEKSMKDIVESVTEMFYKEKSDIFHIDLLGMLCKMREYINDIHPSLSNQYNQNEKIIKSSLQNEIERKISEIQEIIETANIALSFDTNYENKNKKDIIDKTPLLKKIKMQMHRINQAQKNLSETQETLNQTKDELQQKEEKLKQTDEKLKQTENHLKQTENQLKQTETQLKQTENQLEQTDEKLKQTDEKLKQTENQLKQTENQLEQIDEKLKQTDEKLHHVNQEKTNLQDDLINSRNEIENLKEIEDKLLKELNIYKKEYQNLMNIQEANSRSIEFLQTSLKEQLKLSKHETQQQLEHVQNLHQLEIESILNSIQL